MEQLTNMPDALDAAVERQKQVTRDLLAYAALAGDTPMERAAGLITAATVVIEMEVGQAMAPAALRAMVEPTLAQWEGRA